MGSTR
jgi:hypothetical protein